MVLQTHTGVMPTHMHKGKGRPPVGTEGNRTGRGVRIAPQSQTVREALRRMLPGDFMVEPQEPWGCWFPGQMPLKFLHVGPCYPQGCLPPCTERPKILFQDSEKISNNLKKGKNPQASPGSQRTRVRRRSGSEERE